MEWVLIISFKELSFLEWYFTVPESQIKQVVGIACRLAILI